jgi:hypothetical protein
MSRMSLNRLAIIASLAAAREVTNVPFSNYPEAIPPRPKTPKVHHEPHLASRADLNRRKRLLAAKSR